jgi:hypothetical protein
MGAVNEQKCASGKKIQKSRPVAMTLPPSLDELSSTHLVHCEVDGVEKDVPSVVTVWGITVECEVRRRGRGSYV